MLAESEEPELELEQVEVVNDGAVGEAGSVCGGIVRGKVEGEVGKVGEVGELGRGMVSSGGTSAVDCEDKLELESDGEAECEIIEEAEAGRVRCVGAEWARRRKPRLLLAGEGVGVWIGVSEGGDSGVRGRSTKTRELRGLVFGVTGDVETSPLPSPLRPSALASARSCPSPSPSTSSLGQSKTNLESLIVLNSVGRRRCPFRLGDRVGGLVLILLFTTPPRFPLPLALPLIES